MRIALGALALAALCSSAGVRAGAQVNPRGRYETIETAHFRVHFRPAVEGIARRAAANAEVAWSQLSAELVPPRGKVDVLLADDVDYTNGFAGVSPSNRITLYLQPPVHDASLRYTDDFNALIITHELTHIFQLDRSRGIWRLAQRVFGRESALFPNSSLPSWLLEGMAVYYESRITGTGRLNGSSHEMIARAAAIEHRLPRIDQLSLSSPVFPYGDRAYGYGSLFVDYMAHRYGAGRVHEYVEASSVALLPVLLDPYAKRGFGASFSSAFRAWSDSVIASVAVARAPLPAWRDLSHEGGYANDPRWDGDGAITYTGARPQEVFGAFRVDTAGRRTRIGRRNSEGPNVRLADGALLFSQQEFTAPNVLRSDLFVQSRGGRVKRLTNGARLSLPDARRDGAIVAVQALPGITRLVLLDRNGRNQRVLTSASLDELWTEPRWSPDGLHVAAIRWRRGGISEVAVVDTSGAIVQRIAALHSVQSTPSWAPDGASIVFSSDRTGVTQLYRAAFVPGSTGGSSRFVRLSDVQTGLFTPLISADGARLAALVYRGDGFHVGIAPTPAAGDTIVEALADPNFPAARHFDGAARPYSPWRQLLPRYWQPVVNSGAPAGGYRLGGNTSGSDIAGKHYYSAQLEIPTDASGVAASAFYRYSGLSRPYFDFFASQDWERFSAIREPVDTARVIGTLRRRTRDMEADVVFARPRVRTFTSFTLGAGVERREFASDPAPLLAALDDRFLRGAWTPRLVASTQWSNTKRPITSISAEDGVSLAFTTRLRQQQGAAARTRSVSSVLQGTGYLALPFIPGYAHHVIAVRAAGGWADANSSGYYEVGGTSGGTIEVVPGLVLGEGAKTFGVRGFPAQSLVGIRAYAGSAEYRAPLALLGRGIGALPLFLDRSAISLFYDRGSAWCPRREAPNQVCNFLSLTQRHLLSSVGAELELNAAVFAWEGPDRFRLGVALPQAGRDLVGVSRAAMYVSVGLAY